MVMKIFLMAGVMAVLSFTGISAADYHSIVSVEKVNVEVPVGNAPRLPYQLWVAYSDGCGEYRQVKWLNECTIHFLHQRPPSAEGRERPLRALHPLVAEKGHHRMVGI